MMQCPSCLKEVEGNFCSYCGTNLTTGGTIVPANLTKKEKAKITLSFGKSTSKNYAIAVERAMKYDGYAEEGQGNNIVHSVEFTFDQVEDLRALMDLVGGWKTTSLSVDGKLVPYHEISRVIFCYADRQKAYDPKEYCFGRDDNADWNDNDLGCRHCGFNPYGWEGLEGFGHIKKDGTFLVDKNKLVYTVAQNLEPYMICPALDIKAIEKKLKSFPDTINPKTHRDWEYITDYDERHDREIAVGVRKKQKRKGDIYVVKDYNKEFDDDNEKYIQVNKQLAATKSGGCGCLLALLGLIMALILLI